MGPRKFCQSCSMPIDDPKMLGTEKDGSASHEYCKYCYQDGAFVNPDMTMEEMSHLVRQQMEKRNISQDVVNIAVNTLPYLKRWRNVPEVVR